jgi:putative ABC transport system permease protein
MLKNYLKIALRNLLRQKALSFINLAGLATGMACSILILLWVQEELSYDRFHAHADSIYRITTDMGGHETARSSVPLAGALKAELPAVKNAVRLRPLNSRSLLFEVGERKFEEERVIFADSTFFQVFSFRLLRGDPKTALVRPDGLLLTERMAQKYFGTADVLGKTIRMGNQTDFEVTGVLQEVPTNSHLQFDFLLPVSFLATTDFNLINNIWTNYPYFTYLQLDENVASSPALVAEVEKQMNGIFRRNEPGNKTAFSLQPLTKIHLHSKLNSDVEGNGNIQYVRIFAVAAVFILLVACINFMNLATARSARRAKEVGLRKVIGAHRGQLMGQFLGESLLISFLALELAVILVEAVLPAFNDLSGKALSVSFTDGKLFLGLLLIALVTGLLSGSYPALFLSAFQPVRVLKGGVTKVGSGSVFFRNGLVVVQFVVSIVLIVGTAVVYKQLRFIQSQNLGYDQENLLYLPLRGEIYENIDAFRAELERHPSTGYYSFISDLPTNISNATTGVHWEGKDPEYHPNFYPMAVDEHFMEVFKTQLLAGRGFAREFRDDTVSWVLNEKALEVIGLKADEAVGKPFRFWDWQGTIVGVVKDFNFKPIHQPVEPMVLRLNSGWGYLVVRTKPGQLNAAIADLGQIWQKLNPAYPFAYDFLDQDLSRLYRAEERMSTIFNAFALLAIFISCLGLYGLAAFTAEQRTKEISIRKVLGASVANIMGLLSKDFVKLVLIAIVIATPLAWYGMSQWLEDFAYRIDLEWWLFGVAGLMALLIALLTVSFQSVKAALMNPVKSLRSE